MSYQLTKKMEKMKEKNIVFSVILLLLFGSSSSLAQDCEIYFPTEEGSMVEMTNYNGKGKVESVGQTTILKKEVSSGDVILTARLFELSNDNKDTVDIEYTCGCINGTFEVGLFTGLSTESLGGLLEVGGDKLDIPSNPNEGDVLEDKQVIVKIGASEEMENGLLNMKYNFTNRKVEEVGSMKTKAGEFKFIKMSYDLSTRFIVPVNYHVIEWYSTEVGLIRSEMYNKKGKLMSSSEITGYSK